MRIAEKDKEYDAIAKVEGGGIAGQAGAVQLGIARALVKAHETLDPVLREHGMLTRDSRMKERKKYGQPGARKRFQFSKR
jgi:small subunit ribosomal protein S9